jgi:hypothetical protein
MPNRIIKESIRESDSIDNLTPEAEVMFYRLITYADDYGRFKAHPRIINPAIFPLKSYTDNQVIKWLDEIGNNNMVLFYKGTDSKLYGYFTNWHNYQQVRNKKSKHPEPNGSQFTTVSELLQTFEIKCYQLQSNDNNSNQLTADDSNCEHLIGLAPVIQSNPIQSESNPIDAIDINCNQKHGEFKNVTLSVKEYQKLITKIGEQNTKEKIESLSLYMKSTGKKYKSHYATILTWQRNDEKKPHKTNSTSIPRSHPHDQYKSEDSEDKGLPI